MKKKIGVIVACILVIGLVGGGMGTYLIKGETGEPEDTEKQEVETVVQETGDSFTEEGTTSMGTTSQLPEFATNVAIMYVEEVYVESGSSVTEGDALFKIKEDSIEEAKAYYTKAIAAAEDTLEEAQLAYESGKLEAAYELESTKLTAESAEATLELALAELEDDLDTKYGKWQGTANNLSDYTYDIENDVFYTELGIDSKTTAAKNASAAAKTAQSEYEKTMANAEMTLEQLETNAELLQSTYEEAEREAETKRVQLQYEYELAVVEGEYAQANYEATIESLQATVDKAKSSLEDLKEAQAYLLALENGIVCADTSGTIASVTYDAGDILFPGTAFVTYYNTSELTISLEVEQENIAKIAVGDEVDVAISGNRRGTITGKVASIATSATTGRSVSSVTYTVVISIDNTDNTLSAGSSATVTFE